MLINTNIAIAVRCSACGSLKVYDTSLFELFSHKKTDIKCPCGQQNAIIKTKDFKSLWMDIDCFACGGKHTFKYTLTQLLKGNIVNRCIETGLNTSFVVSDGHTEELVDKYEMNPEQLYKELGFLDYFINTEIMMKSLDRIRELDTNGFLGCSCGANSIEMNLFPDRIELKCINCNGIKLIYAEYEEDYKNLYSKEEIIIHESSFECIDAINQNNDRKNK